MSAVRLLFIFLIFAVFGLNSPALADLSPGDRFSLVRLGMAHLDEWDVADARRTVNELLGEAGEDTVVRYLLAQVLFHEGDYAAAVKTLDEMPTTPVLKEAAYFSQLARDTRKATASMVRHDTEHFAIYYVPGRDDILVPYAAETLELAYERVGKDLQYFPPEKVRVEIYPDSDSFTSVTTLTREEIETSGTIALCKFNRIMITTPRMLVRGYGWRDTLTHEYVHYVLSRKTGNRVPLWLHEGIAKFEEARWRENEIAALEPMSESLLAEAMEQKYFISLEQMHPSLAKLKSAEDTQLAFAQVVTMVGYLVRKGGYPMLLKLIDELTNGAEGDEALRKAGGWKSLDAFLNEWKGYLAERELKRIPGLTVLKTKLADDGATEDSEDVKSVADETARKHLRLGDMLRDRKRYAEAAYEYGKARTAAPGFHPVLLNKLGLAHMLAGNLDAAEKALRETLAVYPQFGPANRRLGEVQVRRKNFKGARGSLETALGVNPFDPAIHALLMQVYRELGEEKLAAREEQVISLLKGN